MQVHALTGCTPTPLGHYLKALGILRIVSEQVDPEVRGWWKDEHFWLATKLDEGRLIGFFVNDYRPSPIVAPWNLGSGFFYPDDPSLAPIESSQASRLDPLRAAIASGRVLCAAFGAAIAAKKAAEEAAASKGLSEVEKKSAKAHLDECKRRQDELKAQLIANARREWRGSALQWFDAALTLGVEGDPAYPALLGTGGNDGRLDFTNNFYQHLQRLFDVGTGHPMNTSSPALHGALYGSSGLSLTPAAIGQFLPGYAGGSNMGAGYVGVALVNSWDFVLLFEGTLLFGAGLSRKAETGALPQAAAPFAVRSRAAGYVSAAAGEEPPRGEQWFPLWSAPATAAEVGGLFREGRAQVHRRSATQPVEVARAIARLGVARGIDAFERFGYLERNGQSNLATPLGRWLVRSVPHQELLDDLDRWLAALRRAARNEHAPAGLRSAARACDEAVLDVCRGRGVAQRWQRLLIALGDAERALVASPRRTAEERLGPIPPLSPGWLDAADDDSPELRLAVALASQRAHLRPDGGNPVRMHWSPVADNRYRFVVTNEALAIGPDIVCFGFDLEKDCAALVARRVVMAARSADGPRGGSGQLPLRGHVGCCAPLDDVMGFLDRTIDDARTLGLARALMAIDWRKLGKQLPQTRSSRIDPDYAVVRVAHAPDGVLRRGERVSLGLDPEASRRLVAGDLAGAGAVALRRLRASGLRPVLRALVGDARRARRLAASLAFPITPTDLARCADRVLKPFEGADSGESVAVPMEVS